MQPSRARKEVDVLFEMLRDFEVIRLISVRLAHDRIHQRGGQLTADSAIDGGQPELECLLNEEFLVDHSVEDSTPYGVIDRSPQIAFDTSKDSLVVDSPEHSIADEGRGVHRKLPRIGSVLEQAEGGERKSDRCAQKEEPRLAQDGRVLFGSGVAQGALLDNAGPWIDGRPSITQPPRGRA